MRVESTMTSAFRQSSEFANKRIGEKGRGASDLISFETPLWWDARYGRDKIQAARNKSSNATSSIKASICSVNFGLCAMYLYLNVKSMYNSVSISLNGLVHL